MTTDRETLASLYGLTTDHPDNDTGDALSELDGFRPVRNTDPDAVPVVLGNLATARWVIG